MNSAIKNITPVIAAMSPYEHYKENIHKTGIEITSDMVFVLRIKELDWVVIPLKSGQWIESLMIGKELSKKLNSKSVAYQVTYPKRSVRYQQFESGSDGQFYEHCEGGHHALHRFTKDVEYEESLKKPWEWVNKYFVKNKITDLQIERELIVRNLSETGFGGKEIDKLNYEITRIDAVY